MWQEVHYRRSDWERITIQKFTWSSQADRFARQLLSLGYWVEVYRFDVDGRMIGYWGGDLGDHIAA